MSRPDIIITMRFQVEDNGMGVPLPREAARFYGEVISDYKIIEAALKVLPASDEIAGDLGSRLLNRIASAFANDDGRGQSHAEIRDALQEWEGR